MEVLCFAANVVSVYDEHASIECVVVGGDGGKAKRFEQAQSVISEQRCIYLLWLQIELS